MPHQNHPLLGRGDEMSEFAAALSDVARGAGRIFLLEGEPGIGKTSLVDAALRHADRHGMQVFVSAAEELEARRPFGAIANCLGIHPAAGDPRRAEIWRLLLEPVPYAGEPLAEPAHREFRVTEAIVVLVEEMAARSPVAVVLEDLQWADPSTLLVLHRLARAARHLPLLLACTFRPVPRSPGLQALVRSLVACGGRHLALGPLDEDAVAALVQRLLNARPGPRLLRQVAAAGGNPLFVIELVTALHTAGALDTTSEGSAEVSVIGAPPSLTLTILHRLSFLPQATLDVLRVASVLGSSFSVTELSLVCGQSAFGLMSVLRESIAAGILGEERDRLRFRHDLLRESLYRDLPLAVRAGLHRDWARALAEAGAPAQRVAEHLMRGAAPGDPQAVGWLRRAAREAAPRAPAVALDLLRRALELADPADPSRDSMLAEQALNLMWSGRIAEAEQTCRQVLTRRHDPATEGILRLCLVQALLARGQGEQAAREAAAAATADLTDATRAQLLAWESVAHISLGHLDEAAQLAHLAITAAPEQPTDDLTRCIALSTLATVCQFRGDFAGGLDMAQQAVRLADASPGSSAHRFHLTFYLALFLLEMDRLAEAQAALVRGRQLGEQLGAKWSLPMYQWASAFSHFVAGQWDDAIAECEACPALAQDLGTRQGVLISHALSSIMSLHRNDLAAAERAATAAERELAQTGPQHGLEWWVMLARALLLEATGQPDTACAVLSRAWEQAVTAGIKGYHADLGVDLVRLLIATGNRGQVTTTAATLHALAAANPQIARLRAVAQHCHGLANDDPDVLRAAVAAYRHSCRPLELARACEDAGAALTRRRRATEAATLLEEALDLYQHLQASRDIARVEAALRATGRRRGRRGPRKRPTTGWASLTETERKVAALAAEGMSNPEIAARLFISRHTVHTHLGHILAKLMLGSRIELAAAAARHGPVAQSGLSVRPRPDVSVDPLQGVSRDTPTAITEWNRLR